MGRSLPHIALLVVLLLMATSARGADQTSATRDAVRAMQRGDFQSAEKILRAEVEAHPGDAWTLSLIGVALDNQKKAAEAEEFHLRAMAQSPRAAEILTNYGTHLWLAGQYAKAETVFAGALAVAPAYFLALYNLGVMATYTGHYDRAREVLEAALRQQPQNVDVLFRLASVDEASRNWESAVMRLAQAAKFDPRRADVQKLLAQTTGELEALDDSAAAWDRYLKLEPNDEAARRERGYVAAQMGKLEQGIADLEWFVARHPDDPVGHYELGQAQRSADMTQALLHLDRALALNPNYAPARVARGSLYYQEGKPESAVKDLELAASLQPDDAQNLDRLGQSYQALDRTGDAVRVLRRAAELAPGDSKTLLHLARALADDGQTDESKAVMDRFRRLGPDKKKGVPAGLVEYLSLAPAARRAEFRARVEKAVADDPEDSAAQVAYLKLMLEAREANKAAAAVKRIAAMKPGAAVLEDAGHALVKAQEYALAGELMERIPEAERGGDYYLARAKRLEAAGKSPDAAAAFERALRTAPDRPDLYLDATAFRITNGDAAEALRTIGDAARRMPDNREILLRQATTLEFAHRQEEAGRALEEIQGRWPEWPAVWMARGMIFHSHQRYEEARQALETAVALGARGAETYYYLADATLRSGPEHHGAAETLIQEAVKVAPDDPWIQALAGRIAVEGGQYRLAEERLRAAIRMHPGFVEARRNLARVYRALGREQEADAEMAEIARSTAREEAPPYLGRLFEGSLFRKSFEDR
ncbi:MAG TPA: tetratricopeptide repeat protein [Bryobacteraceae bacterium]